MNARQCPRYRRAVERVHRLGVRPVAELLLASGATLADVERYAALDRCHPVRLNHINVGGWAPSIFGLASS